MAASDRLKALDAKIRADEYATAALSVYAPWLLDALPQIVALVRAMEENEKEALYPTMMFLRHLENIAACSHAALAALDEALSPPTGGSP